MKTYKILLIDDEEELLEIYSEVLRDEGFQVEGSSSSVAAADLVASTKFDLVLCDFTMPCGGAKNLVSLLGQSEVEIPPVAIISGHAKDDFELQGLDVVKLFSKPIDLDILVTEVKHILEENVDVTSET